MDPASWVYLGNDLAMSWYSIFSNRQMPITAAQTQAAVYLEQQRQTNNTLLLLALGGAALYMITRR